MTKYIFLLILLLSFSNCFSQDYELRITPFQKSKIIYTDGSSEIGLLRLASSTFSLRFKKNEEEKERKIDYKKIDKIITNPETEKERIFQYLGHNYNKFKIFVEQIYADTLSIYISLTNSADLFYSDFDRQSLRERIAKARYERDWNFGRQAKSVDTIHLPNEKQLIIPKRYAYYYDLRFGASTPGASLRIDYYLLKEGDTKLYKVENNNRFLKKAKDILEDCPSVVLGLEQNEISLDDLPEFIDYYKNKCAPANNVHN